MATHGRIAPPSCVRQINIGGEQVNRSVVSRWHERSDHRRITLHNVYGPTECAVDTTVARLVEGGSDIGRPIENYTLYILGPEMSLVPFGSPGELYVAGAGLARGYLNRPSLTAQRFVANPFYQPHTVSSSSRLYRTGDLVRYQPNGTLEFLGRVDDQVKVRGFRVELGEIESWLARHAAVSNVVVVARDCRAGQKQLVAYVTPRDGAKSDPTLDRQLKAYLRQLLPEYMVPSAVVALDAFPATPNGKIDLRCLTRARDRARASPVRCT